MRATDAARGLIITVIICVVGYFVALPAPEAGQNGISISRSGLYMLLAGIGLQIAIILSRPLLARFERANGLEGQISPMAVHILQLLADGLTVLLFALAVFGGINSFNSSI